MWRICVGSNVDGSPRPWHCLMYVSQTLTPRPTHSELSLPTLSSAEEAKKKKYSEAFTPFVVSVDGVLGREANFLSNILLRNMLISGKSQTVRYWDG